MRLVGKAAHQCDLTERLLRRRHQMPGVFDPPAHDVTMRCLTEMPAEGAAEMARAQRHQRGEVGDADRCVDIVVDEALDTLGLPRGQAPGALLCSRRR